MANDAMNQRTAAQIISASRRTDIPSFYGEWLMHRLRAGYALTQNPFNAKQVKRISLLPQDVDCLVLWSKNPQPLLAHADELTSLGYTCLMHFSLLPYSKNWHPHLPAQDALVNTFLQWGAIWGRQHLIWRYDPIVLDDTMTIAWHAEHFERLCDRLHGATDTVTFSFVDRYRHIAKDLFRSIDDTEMLETAAAFGAIARQYGLHAQTCCEKIDLSHLGIQRGACIDLARIEQLSGQNLGQVRDRNQRPLCGCAQSVDIGMYNTCGHACAYCYATRSTKSSERNVRAHNPYSELLIEKQT